MDINYPVCYAAVRRYEGGNDDDPRDPGGRTSRGIIQREWNEYRKTHPGRPADVWKASEEDIAAIYKDDYWTKQSCGTIVSGVDESVFDYGVNSGVGRSRKVLRRCLHLTDNAPTSDVLKRLGMLTPNGVSMLIEAINDERMAFLKQLKTWQFYGRGWSRRVADVRRLSHSLAKNEGAISTELSKERTPKGQVPDPKGAKNGTIAGGTGTGIGTATQFDPATAAIIIVLIVVAVGVTIYLINRNHKKKQEAPPKGWTPPIELKGTPT